jgi:ABC-type transport system substrate-binding protein
LKKLFIPVVVLLVIATIITACSSSPTTTNPAPITTAATTVAPITTAATSVPPTSATSKPATTAPVTTAVATTTAPAANKYGGTLKVIENSGPSAALGAEWEGNSPPVYDTQQWAEERLLKEKGDGNMQPELAASWDATSTGDNPNIVFHLQKGVKFSDGSDWNAQALAWNLDMYKKGAMFGSTTNYWKSWDILDDYTLRLNYTVLLNTATRSWENYFMVSPTAYTKNGIEWMRTHTAGTNAFVQTDFQRDVSATFVKNPNYWQQGKPYLDGVQLLYVVDNLTREALMKSNGGDVLYATVQQLSHFPTSDYNVINRNAGAYVMFPDSKNADSPWSNAKVRQAADYAIDKEGLNTALGFGYGAAAYQIASSSALAFDPALSSKYRKYDVAKAKQLLTDAGFPSGFKTTLYIEPGWAAGSGRDYAVSIQSMWAKVGIVVDLQFPQAAAWQQMSTANVAPKTSSLLAQSIPEFGNFNVTLNVVFPKADAGFYYQFTQKPGGDAAWAVLKDKSLSTPAPDPVILKQIEDAFFDDCTAIPITYPISAFVTSKRLNDSGLLKFGTFNAFDYANTWLSK